MRTSPEESAMRLRQSAIAAILMGLIAAGAAAGPTAPRPALLAATSSVISNPDIARFLALEATVAGVARIQIVHQGPKGNYGGTSMNSATRAPAITINVDRPGAASATNLAHEIAHAWAMRHGCFNHGERWLSYHLGIAERFEARFPGVKWSGVSPTRNVRAKAARYPNDHC
jgi:hypothetical protein